MRKLLILASVGEGLTGLILFMYPLIAIRLFFDSEIAGAGMLAGRIAGLALIALGVACWPGGNMRRAFFGMLTYGVLITLFLIYAGLNLGAGILLWPGVAAHAMMSALLIWAWRMGKAGEWQTL